MSINKLGLFLTRKCNFRCAYCYNQTRKDPVDKMTFEELKALLLQAKNMGAKRLVVAGEGEPLLDNNLFPLFEYARKLGINCDVTTNISLLDSKTAQWFFSHKVRIFAKLYSLNPVVQDKLAGRKQSHQWVDYSINGEHITIPRGLKNLLEAGYGVRQRRIFSRNLLAIQPFITALNMADILKIAKFCRACGLGIYVKKWFPSTSTAFDRKFIPSREQELQVYKEVIPLMDWESRAWIKLRCAFETDPFIDVSGNIRFCYIIDKSVGNIRDTSLQKLHSAQLRIKDTLGAKSHFFTLRTMGFRDCRSRRLLNNEHSGQCKLEKEHFRGIICGHNF